jgi:hypothetical protein
MVSFQGSLIQAAVDPASSIDEFFETFWVWVLEDQGIFDSPGQALAKSASKCFIVPADKALTEAEFNDECSNRTGLF